MGFKMKGPTFFSVKGYKKNSPDVNKSHNVINSGDITMEDVEFDVRGEDNLGNVKIMKPGKNYKFPGNVVKETPVKQWESYYPEENGDDKKDKDKDKPGSKCYIDEDGKKICRADIDEKWSEEEVRKYNKRFPATSQEELDKINK